MKARHALIIAVSCVSFGTLAIAGDSRTQAPPPQQQRQPSTPQPSRTTNSQTPSSSKDKTTGSSTGSNTGTSTGDSRRGSDRQNGYDQYGRPITGVYYPNQYGDPNNPNNPNYTPSSSSTSNNPQSSSTPTTMPSSDSTASSDSGSTASWRTTPTTDKKSAVVSAPDPEVAAATAELNTAMDEVKQSLRNNPDYKAAMAEKDAAKAEASALHARTDATPDEALPIAQRGLVASKKLQQLEHDAAVKDPRVQAARARLDAAIAGHASKPTETTAVAK